MWESKRVSIGLFLKTWADVTGCEFLTRVKGFGAVVDCLNSIEGVEVYGTFYVRLISHSDVCGDFYKSNL